MKKYYANDIEKCRVLKGMYASQKGDRHGAFLMPGGMVVLASDGSNWDHVSVSFSDRCPTWEEMCMVKDWFFDAEDAVIQYHPRKSQYRNYHPFCLHLWRPQKVTLPEPPAELVAP